MKSNKIIKRIGQTDCLLKTGNTGNANDLARKLDVSKRTVFNLFKMLKEDFDAPIIYDKRTKSYKYATRGNIVIAFVAERVT